MGVRLYDPNLGRFLQTDPEPGGSDNAYDYAHQDPYNTYDLDGNSWWKKTKRFVSHHKMDIALTAVGFIYPQLYARSTDARRLRVPWSRRMVDAWVVQRKIRTLQSGGESANATDLPLSFPGSLRELFL